MRFPDAVLSAARRPLQLTLGAWHKHLYIIVSARAQASEFAKQAPMRIVEQPRGSRSIYEYETVFELAPGFCANCIRASLLAGTGPPDFPFRLLGHRYHSRGGLDRARHGRTGGAGR